MTAQGFRVALIVAALCAMVAPTAQGVITTYTDSAAFLTAIGGAPTFLDDYEGEPVDSIIPDAGDLNGVTYFFPVGVEGRIDNIFGRIDDQSLAAARDEEFFSFFFPGESFTVVLPEPALAFGIFINGGPDSDEYFIGSAEVFAAVASSGTYDTGTLYFLGFTSDVAFTMVEIGAGIDAEFGYNVDNLMYSTVVPEPSTLALLLAGVAFAGLASARFVRRRRG